MAMLLVWLLLLSLLAAGTNGTNLAPTNVLFAIASKDAVVMSSSSSYSSGRTTITSSYNYIHAIGCENVDHNNIVSLRTNKLPGKVLVGFSGDISDCDIVLEALRFQSMDYYNRVGRDMSVKAVASFLRKILADSLRQRRLRVNILVGGVEGVSPALYYIDSTAAMQKVPYAVHGAEFAFVLSTLDRYNRNELNSGDILPPPPGNGGFRSAADVDGLLARQSVDECLQTVRSCWSSVRKRTVGRLEERQCAVKYVCAAGCFEGGHV